MQNLYKWKKNWMEMGEVNLGDDWNEEAAYRRVRKDYKTSWTTNLPSLWTSVDVVVFIVAKSEIYDVILSTTDFYLLAMAQGQKIP